MNAVFQAAFLPCNCGIPLVFISSDQALQWGALQSIHHLISRKAKKFKVHAGNAAFYLNFIDF